jgi:hypothetical protein
LDEHEAYYRRFYAKMDTKAILGILKGPAMMDSSRPAALAVLAARGMTPEELQPYAVKRRDVNSDACNGDKAEALDRLDHTIELLGDAADTLDW